MTLFSIKTTWMVAILVLSQSALASALSQQQQQQQSSLKVRVCSGCLGKCRGSFNPITSFEQLAAVADTDTDTETSIEIEETFCMNQCKKGPNVRLINAENQNVLAFDDTIMNEIESSRKAFQRVSNEDRINYIWGIANGVLEGEIVASEKGSVDKLHDIMPKKQ